MFEELFVIQLFIRPYLDYRHVNNQHSDKPFLSRTESIQYYTVLAITGAIRGSSREKLYQELEFEHFHQRR